MPNGGTFSVSLSDVDGNRLRLSFTDTGCGMAPEQVERLFEPFTSTTGGTRLGLSIFCKSILAYMGKINHSARLGKGTTITVEVALTREMQGEVCIWCFAI